LLIGKSNFTILLLVGNTHLLSTYGGSSKRWWVGKNFADATYNDSRRGSVKLLLLTHYQVLIMNRGVVNLRRVLRGWQANLASLAKTIENNKLILQFMNILEEFGDLSLEK
jgi:hypothetical protein